MLLAAAVQPTPAEGVALLPGELAVLPSAEVEQATAVPAELPSAGVAQATAVPAALPLVGVEQATEVPAAFESAVAVEEPTRGVHEALQQSDLAVSPQAGAVRQRSAALTGRPESVAVAACESGVRDSSSGGCCNLSTQPIKHDRVLR